MNGENPCNICSHVSCCDGCIFYDKSFHTGECGNYLCFLNYDCGCLMGMDDKCKASTCFKEPGVWVMDAVEDDDEEDDSE